MFVLKKHKLKKKNNFLKFENVCDSGSKISHIHGLSYGCSIRVQSRQAELTIKKYKVANSSSSFNDLGSLFHAHRDLNTSRYHNL